MAAWLGLIAARSYGANPLRPHFFSTRSPYLVKVGIPEFLTGVGKGVETHIAKLDAEIGDFQKLLVTRTLRLKKLGIPCKHHKLFCIIIRFLGTVDASVVRFLLRSLKTVFFFLENLRTRERTYFFPVLEYFSSFHIG
ncbi:uncharacterized protein LOC144713453 isoform X1 [Wolffia australiana]